ncbi:hypothetical protein Cgig2_015908 [Carnegiea gigantea]|uniref:Uncharacterized protein n=1 Tax=Carnegiea gigantea TaxID=171969 RepID=A0A9Q1JIG1_9CARY|nr:hypothetical protein Cgig2_015908 [Carnegiea gigantea]
MMFRTFAAFSHHILSKRKSPKVADETMFSISNEEEFVEPVYAHDINGGTRQQRSKGFLVISTIVRIPFSLLSCFSYHHGHGLSGQDGMWVTGETVRTAEIDHLMITRPSNMDCRVMSAPATMRSSISNLDYVMQQHGHRKVFFMEIRRVNKLINNSAIEIIQSKDNCPNRPIPYSIQQPRMTSRIKGLFFSLGNIGRSGLKTLSGLKLEVS